MAAAYETGLRDFVMDLEACAGMDSTFMGMLAGLGIKFRREGGGALSIIGTSQKTKASLIELGLHHLSQIEPDKGPWQGRLEEIRRDLIPILADGAADKESHILKCHENLCEADEQNLHRFKTVLDMLGSKIDTEAEKPSQ